MKNIFKLGLLSVSMISTLLLGGCTSDEAKLLDSFRKMNDVNSAKVNSTIDFNLKVSGLSDEINAQAYPIINTIDNASVQANTEVKKSADNSMIKYKGDFDMTSPLFKDKAGIWVDSNLANNKLSLKEIITLPSIVSASQPDFKGKKYMVIDFDKMNSMADAQTKEALNNSMAQLKTIMGDQGKTQKVMNDLVYNLLKQINVGKAIVTKNDSKIIEGKTYPIYKVTIDDATFKELLKNGVNQLVNDKQSLKEFLGLFAEMMGNQQEQLEFKKNLEKDFDSVYVEFKKELVNFNKFMDAMKDAKLIGDKGIVLSYVIDDNGYIIYNEGSYNFNLDMNAINKAVQQLGEDSEMPSELENVVVQFGFDCKSTVTNINEDFTVQGPIVNASNSIDIAEYTIKKVEEQYKSMEKFNIDRDTYNNEYNKTKEIYIRVNNSLLELKSKPKKVNGRVLVPLRGVLERVNANVNYDTKTKSVIIKKAGKSIVLKANSKAIMINGKKSTIDVPATTINGVTYVPLRFISQQLGAEVQWLDKANAVYIRNK